MLRFEHPIRLPAKLQRGGRVTKEDVLAARTQQGEEGVVNPHAVREEPPPVPHEDFRVLMMVGVLATWKATEPGVHRGVHRARRGDISGISDSLNDAHCA